jgi:ubiquitin carboxyl-terminal hydrolase 5/13
MADSTCCPHASALRVPSASATIYKDECTLCFSSQDSEGGLDVCLTCWNGSCTGKDSQGAVNHSQLHFDKTNHPVVLNIKRREKVSVSLQVKEDESASLLRLTCMYLQSTSQRPQKLTKVAIQEENEADKYDILTVVRCLLCKKENLDVSSGQVSGTGL